MEATSVPIDLTREEAQLMKLSAPNKVLWLIAVILGVLGILAYLGVVPQLAVYAFWLVVIAFVLLVIGTLFTGI